MSAPPMHDPNRTTAVELGGRQPYVKAHENLAEFTWPALLVGAVLGVVFGASSLYLVLKVGLTVSASIPVAVLSITLFRIFSRMTGMHNATILENNIVQTTGSAGESIAFGVGVTMPALMLLGFEMDIGRVMTISILGGLLGVLMMIPLRRAFIVKKHDELKYPEGTACAGVLIVGEQGGTTATTVFVGFGVGFVFQFLYQGFKLWKETVSTSLTWFKGAAPAMEVNPTLLGVGYIVGTRISCIMVGGGVLSSFVLIPLIRLFGEGLQGPLFPAKVLISKMSVHDIWKNYILYIGAGAVAAGGIISLFQALPLIAGSIRAGLQDIRKTGSSGDDDATPRTDRDLPLGFVGVGTLVLVAAIWATTPLHAVLPWIPQLNMNLLGAGLIVIFGFLFVTVSSRLTGMIGSSNNPISGMTVATLLLTCLIFLMLGWVKPEDRLTALSVAAVVCIAASNGGTTSQDLKTGYLVGGTPKWQQLAILIGAFSSSLVIGWILIFLNSASTVYTTKNLPTLERPLDVSKLPDLAKAPDDDETYHVWRATEGNPQSAPAGKYLVDEAGKIRYLVDPGINGSVRRKDDGTEVVKFDAPKARLMSLITDGILTQKLPWSLVLLGVSISLVLELCGVASLPFAVGVYLPLATTSPIFVGGLIRYLSDRYGRNPDGGKRSDAESDMSPGVLLSTGYIAGGAIAGVIVAFLAFSDEIPRTLAAWQFKMIPVAQERPLRDLAHDAALRELGVVGETLAKDLIADVGDATDEIVDLNKDQLTLFLRVKKGMALKLPGGAAYTVPEDTYLKDVAAAALKSQYKAQLLLDLNGDQLKEPTTLPPGAMLKTPQTNVPALVAFAGLALFLLLVGAGRLMNAPAVSGHAPTAPVGERGLE